jgi:Protein of unknown function (DUF2855)
MPTETDTRLLIHRRDLARTRRIADPDRPGARPLADGEARLAVAQFALTANNITYAAFGEAMKYWQFFPAPATEGPDWACLPVWGFATVTESRAEGLAPGRRVWGYFPAGSHLVVQPMRAGAQGFVDGAAHRRDLAAIYNGYAYCDADPAWSSDAEGLQAVLKPLFTTAYLLDDFLAEQGFFGARQLLLSSASSKTAYATAFCLMQRRGSAGAPAVIGLTSPAHREFAAGLACYDRVALYDEVAALDPSIPSLYVDFAGHAGLRRAVHEHFGAALAYSASIGGTHWTALGGGAGLPGPRPVLFFAPAQAKKRSAPPPDGWGTAGLQQRLTATWAAFLVRVQQPGAPWLRIVTHQGGQAIEAAYHALLEGRADPREGLMLVP